MYYNNLNIMKEKSLNSVWILTIKTPGNDREIYGVFSSENAANYWLENDLFSQCAEEYEGQNLSNEEIHSLLIDELDPDIQEYKVD